MMKSKLSTAVISAAFLLAFGSLALAQSGATRPRRVLPTQPTPAPNTGARNTDATDAARASQPAASTPTRASASSSSDTTRAFSLLQQKQFAAALAEARKVAEADPKNSEAWKIAGFAGIELKRYAEAAADLQRALELQRAAGEEDANTADALATAYIRAEKYEQALPLLVAATTRKGAKPDASTFYYRAFAELKTGKTADAERSFNEVVKLDPKNSASLYYLGRFAFERKELDAAINLLNRSTTANPQFAEGWSLLTYSYLGRAAAAGSGPKADADFLSAVRASESLMRARPDEASTRLHGQVLIQAKQYARAATALERVAASNTTQGETLYLLGFAYTQVKNSAKAAAVLERAAVKSPNDVNVLRLLGYNYEILKQYAKALATYEKGLQLAPEDAEFKASAERVRPAAQ